MIRTLRKGFVFWGLVISAMAHGASYQRWLSEHFEETEIAQVDLQATLWGLEADPDRDGRKNLLEYALGSDPVASQASDFGIVLELASEEGQPIIPRMRFRQRTDDLALSYGLEVSDDLQLWQTGEHWLPLAPVNLPDEPFQEVTYEYRDPAGPGEARFFRLRVLLFDSDGDGLPDDYEEQIIEASLADGDPSNDLFTVAQVLAEADFDGDGLSNGEEFVGDTDPAETDTDGDTVEDFVERQIGADPNDNTEPVLYYISTAGSDANLGSETEPFASIGRALLEVLGPTVIRLASGVYSDHFQISGEGIALEGVTGTDETVVFSAIKEGTALSHAVYFADFDNDGTWSEEEPQWIDTGPTPGLFDAGDTLIQDAHEELQPDITEGSVLSNTLFSDTDGNGLWQPTESLWLDRGILPGEFDAADTLIFEGRDALLRVAGGRNIYLGNLHWEGPLPSIAIEAASEVFFKDQAWNNEASFSMRVTNAQVNLNGVSFGRGRDILWNGASTVQLFDMQDTP